MPEALPHSEEVEAALVARLLQDPAQIAPLVGVLPAEDLYSPDWRRTYLAMQRLASEHRTVDLVTLQDALGEQAQEIGIRLLEVGLSSSAPVEEYAQLIRRDAFRRRVIGALGRVMNEAYVEEDRGKLLADIHDAVVQISEGVEDGRLVTASQAVDQYLETLERRSRGEDGGLYWGLSALNQILNPAMGGEMIVLAARPSVGKTALAELIADEWAEQAGFPVLFASLEMGLDSLIDRAVGRLTTIPTGDIIRGVLTSDAHGLARETAESRRSVRLWYLDDPRATTGSIRASAARVRIIAGGVSAIVVDYLQLLADQDDNPVNRVTRISRQLKALSREFDVPVLVLSQLNRAVMQRPDQHPQLHDLRESGAIEQDADVVLGLYRPLGQGLTDVDVLKQRRGGVGRVQVWFDQEHVRFTELTDGMLEQLLAYRDEAIAEGTFRGHQPVAGSVHALPVGATGDER